MIEKIRQELKEQADETYRNFHASLVPGLTDFLGVRVPVLRTIARKLAKDDWRLYLSEASDNCYEELMLQGMVLGYALMEKEERAECLRRFLPKINNWAVCDCCCSTWKFMRKDLSYWYEFLLPFLNGGEYEIRSVVVCLMDHFSEKEYLSKQFEIYNHIRHEGYYVEMAVAWALSVCYVRFPQETAAFFRDNALDDFTQNKAIQKCRESYRISKEEKEMLNGLKRGKTS
ncbi:MAG TPA: DNA alkylation repair protein [Candidatus Pullilachnospira intestinigallinarum]|nr:DNA alkylation repair protein [Candidatus Pullilachnospira intestinigallinarum]